MKSQVGKVDLNLTRTVEDLSTPVDLTAQPKAKAKPAKAPNPITLTNFGKDLWLAVADTPYGPGADMHVQYCLKLKASGLLDKSPYHYHSDSRFTLALRAALESPSTAAELYQSVAGEKEKKELLEKCFSGL